MKRLGFLLLFTQLYGLGYAQLTQEQGWDLPPLQALIDSALKCSATLKTADIKILLSEDILKEVRMSWLEKLNFTVNSNYGNTYDWARTASASQTGGPYPANNSNPSLGYMAGISIYYPFIDIFGGHKRMKHQAQLGVEQAEIEKKVTENETKQMVITAYYELLSTIKTLELQTEMLISLTTSYEQAKKDFSAAKIPLSEYIKAYEAYMSARNAQEIQKNSVTSAFMLMEILTGTRLLNK
ncbi:MAG: TolC family protein [Bacteroidales bacterium]|jgi:outer membrane protein TolC|nr:TolC family protein [Bacteroidales bacterium]